MKYKQRANLGKLKVRDHSYEPDELTTIEAALKILAKRSMKNGELLTDPAMAERYMQLSLASCDREHFAVAALGTRHNLIAFEVLFSGTIDGTEVHPREVAKFALKHGATAVIVGHNHPSGNPEPSAADRAVTARLKQALNLLDIRLLDHFVVTADGKPVSLAARGWV